MNAVISRRIAAAVAACLAPVLVTGCAVTIQGSPFPADKVVSNEVDPSILRGGDGGEIDQIAAATVTDVQEYWRQQFEPAFGEQWRDIEAFYSVDTQDSSAPPPPCVESASDVEGNAFYCGAQDIIAFDRTALFPVLVERYGEAGVVVVLAHEVGHAVHNRLGIDVEKQRAEPQIYPTIVLEAMADCYAGVFLKWVVEGNAQHLDIDTDQLDSALGALVSFRDPVGADATDRGAHGNAFDRVSSFQDGFDRGPELCSEITTENRPFTLREFTSIEDEARGGNLPLPELVELITQDLDTVFDQVVQESGGGDWQAPELSEDARCSGDQGPIAFCPDDGSIALEDSEDLAEVQEVGDFATGSLMASRYGLAALAALGRDTEGDDAGRAAICLAGVYTGAVLTREEGFGLSPGDLDEAVMMLLRYDFAARDAGGDAAPGSGFERVALFRTGTLEGLDACDLG